MRGRLPRRDLLKTAAGCLLGSSILGVESGLPAAPADTPEADSSLFFQTRGVVVVLADLASVNWPERARRAGLTTIGTHIFPHEVAAFIESDRGQAFLEECREREIHVEHELHAMSDLLPRELFAREPAMFPMNEEGERVRDYNLCIHSRAALDVVGENVVKYTRILRSTTGRYFYWIDDGRPMCRCPKCRELSDSDQALLLEHHVLGAVRQVDPRATLCHIAYSRTLDPPNQIKPLPGIFLEFAPIERLYNVPFSLRETVGHHGITHARLLDALDANLEVFGSEGAQALEYWLDLSRFSGWKRENIKILPWNDEIFAADLDTYGRRGIRHVTTFAPWLDADYVRRFGEPPVDRYGQTLRQWKSNDAKSP